MRLFRTLVLTGVLALAGTACADLAVTNLNAPDRERAISTPGDVESLISGAYTSVWVAMHQSYPGAALGTAADSHTSSWGNFGMRDWGWEPRIPINNDPSYSYRAVMATPWSRFYGALAAVRDGLLAIEGGIDIGTNGADTPRAVAFARFVQGLSLAYVGVLFDKGFIVDETSELESLTFASYQEVHAAGIAKLVEAEQLARAGSFTIPASWLGFDRAWTSAEFARLISSWRGRLRTQVARTPAENDAIDWATVLSDVQAGLGANEDYATYYDGTTVFWDRQKLHGCCINGWAQTDVRTYGPADQSGKYQTWLATAPDDRRAFNVVTDDKRVSNDPVTGTTDGTYLRYDGSSPFIAARGYYHFSNYRDYRFADFYSTFIGRVINWHPSERAALIAEANVRLGNGAAALPLVNASRTAAGLPAYASASSNAPGERCVPRTSTGACGSFLEGLKYEKRMENFHYGPFTEYLDDRRWGDLVSGSAYHLPVPGAELLLLLEEIYSFGGGLGGEAPNLINDLTPEGLAAKRLAFERWTEAHNEAEGAARAGVVAH